MKILVLDNYDSFTYNLVHAVEKIIDADVDVFRNDEISPENAVQYERVILSPGPGLPANAGIMNELIQRYSSSIAILGVCLGHQAICEVFGGSLCNLDKVYHGVSSTLKVVKDDALFSGLPEHFEIGHYHSWVAELPENSALEVTAVDSDSRIMAVRHKSLNIRGVQFHPESVLTPLGEKILENWIRHC